MKPNGIVPFLCGVLALLLATPALAESATPIPIEAFFSNPAFQSPRLSGDGKYLAFLYSEGDEQIVIVRATTGGAAKPLAKITSTETRLNWLQWANPDRLLLSGTARNKRSVKVRSRITRLFGVDREGGELTWLGRRWDARGQGQWEVQIQDRILSWLPDDPDHVLISYRDPFESTPSVQQMDVHTGTLSTRQRALDHVDQWYVDNRGKVRAGKGSKGTYSSVYARAQGKGELRKVLTHDVFEDSAFGFAAFHEDPKKLYAFAAYEGRLGLFEFDIEKGLFVSLVFAHPEVDVKSAIYSDVRRKVVGVRYIVDEPEAYYFDEDVRSERAALDQALLGVFEVPTDNRIVSATNDGMLVIVRASCDTQPPVYYLYDRRKKSLNKVLTERPEIPIDQLVPTTRINYTARDGVEIGGYLTLPRGAAPGKLPMIVLPHGGPWARDWKRYDPEVQMFANRGFAVLQMNFRGSTGFGSGFTSMGHREWGQAIQDDITDGVKWAIEQGIADPDRIGIYGASYGGYSAMMGLIRTPELFRAGASYAGVMDVKLLIKHDQRYYDWRHAWHEALIGGERGDRKRLRKHSPVEHAADIRAPVLLGHGEDDQRVHVQHSRDMAKALKKAKKRVEYLEFEDEIHGFLLERNRIQFYERLVAFFEQNLARKIEEPGGGSEMSGELWLPKTPSALILNNFCPFMGQLGPLG